ncbi:Carbonic anhydrase 2 [Anatilimnocola aggregata]|uniref:Carbonic anhydrase 2 n=1 Tax=Anatilimnocola aggregata TaxID=2528021 RepID=A0A517YCK3_9BACT|nr:SulP family inorganic anion transporter [Anatilimnocola aggregata]QDU27958.1 Carbonic anhydrase 2 [Anatilimnocola aggregata]
MPLTKKPLSQTLPRDVSAGIVVFLVALPLCLGVALASGAPLLSGVLAGIVGGILVGVLSGSHTSVSGPAAGLTAVVAAQIVSLGSFQTFLLAVVLAGLLQIGLGLVRAGFIASFFPSSVIKGLLAAVGLILILKQIPHIFGHDADPEGDLAFLQPDHENTFTELLRILGDVHPGAAVIGFLSLAILIVWDRWKPLQKSLLPAPLVVVLIGVGLSQLFRQFGSPWAIGNSHLVQVPITESFSGLFGYLQTPDFSQWANPAVYVAALTIAAFASLETLLNLEAVDKLDPRQRTSPPSRELLAQGFGNIATGLIGGLPVTSVVIRSSVNINADAQTKLSAVIHGVLMLVCVGLLPMWLNLIPLSCLAAILLITGAKLVSPALVKQMWNDGRYQFIPFAVTVVAIILSDLLIGILVGLAVSLVFILNSNMRRPIRRSVEKHLGGDVLHIELANQVSFLNRAALAKVLDEVPRGGHLLLDAQKTDYIDPDILDLIREFKEQTAPARGVEVSLLGFRSKYLLEDQTQYVDYATRELQSTLTPQHVLQILKDGHERFRTGQRLTRDLSRQVSATADGQFPLAVVLSCIDSRTPAELIFDLGVGDIFSVRIAGNITSRKVLASVEYGCAVAGAKLILVMGHTRCGAVTAAVSLIGDARTPAEVTGCQHLDYLVSDIQQSTTVTASQASKHLPPAEKQAFVDAVARRNVARVVAEMRSQSQTLDRLVREGRIAIVGAMYDVFSGQIDFLPDDSVVRLQPMEG